VATTKTAEDRLTSLREQLRELDLRDVRDRAGDVRDLAADIRDDVRDLAVDVRSDVRDRVPGLLEDLEPVARQAQIRWWELVRQVVSALLVLPRLLVRGLGALPGVVGSLTDLFGGAAQQGGELAERARDAASSVPTLRRMRRRRRTQLAAWTAGGFALGALTGWLLGRRQRAEMVFDPVAAVDERAPLGEATEGTEDELVIPSVNGAAAVAPDVPVRE
jgi:hypothetical protein